MNGDIQELIVIAFAPLAEIASAVAMASITFLIVVVVFVRIIKRGTP